jgi:hypothetical protein
MMTKIKHFDKSLLKTNGDISSTLVLLIDITLLSKLTKLGVSCWLSSHLILILKLGCTEWLEQILNDIEPNKLHFDLGEVGNFPEYNLVAHMH